MKIFETARKHGVGDSDMLHAIENAIAVGEQDDGKVLYLGPDHAGNLLEIIAVVLDDGSEIVIHAMHMRPKYESFLRYKGDTHD